MQPSTDRPAIGVAVNGADSSDGRLEELRSLIFGPELTRIARLQERLDDPELRAQDLTKVLLTRRVRKALQEALRSILKREPEVMAEAVRPIVLLSVRKAVADAFREFAESLNQIAEKSISPRALQWRLEALRTGKKFSDIVLSRSLLYSVREVFLIHATTGIMLQQATKEAVAKDADMISSMFTAIQEFVRDSFIGTESKNLETIDAGSFKLWIQHGTAAMVVGAVDGMPPVQLKEVFRNALDEIQAKFCAELTAFQGDVAPFEATRPILQKCLLGRSGPKRRRQIFPWVLAAATLALLAIWIYSTVRTNQRWNSYLRKLNSEPGILVTRTENRGSNHSIYGLRDRMAANPALLLNDFGIPVSKVSFRFEPYQSLDPVFVARRELESEKSAITNKLILFAAGQAQISPQQMDEVNDLAVRMNALAQAAHTVHVTVSIDVVGHTDELGSEESNLRLSRQRAGDVAAVLVEDGVEKALLTPIGVATSDPVRKGSTERDHIFNRSVSFRINVRP